MDPVFNILIIIAVVQSNIPGVLSQNISITVDTVYIRNNAVGQVTCILNCTCSAISWYLSSITAPLAQAYPGFPCVNSTKGYYQTCGKQNNQYNLYFIGSKNLHGQNIRCTGSGCGCNEQQIVSDAANISIIVPVTLVSLERFSDQQITVIAGQSKFITCVTGTSRPAPHIMWYIGGTNVTSLSTESFNTADSDMYNTRSTLKFTPKKSQNGLQLNCKAYNTDYNMVELTTKPTLNVQYPPDNTAAIIVGQSESVSVVEGDIVTLECVVMGGNPLATITWNCFGLIGMNFSDSNMTKSSITFIATNTRNGGLCTCSAIHPAVTIASDSIVIYVEFAAKITSMEISGGNNFTIREHSTKTISCLAEGLPLPRINLRYISNNSILKSAEGVKLEFTFPSARCEDTGTYECDAINKFTPQKPLQKDMIVLCKPRAAQEPLQNQYALTVGKTLNIIVPYLAYPRPTFQWFENISNGSSTELTDGHQNVEINNTAVNKYTFVTKLIRENLKESGFGTYILKAQNIIGIRKDVYVVRAKGNPESPVGGQAICVDYKSAVITWTSKFDNGDDQTFDVVYNEEGGEIQTSGSNINDPGLNKQINHTVVSLQESKTYFFQIYSKNAFGESSRLKVNCSTGANPDTGSSTGLAVGAGLGSAVVLIIIVVVVIFVLRRFKDGKPKGKKGLEMNGRFALTPNDEEEDGMRDNILYDPTGPYNSKFRTSVDGKPGPSGCIDFGGNDYSDADIGSDNPAAVYAEVQKNSKKEKKPDPSAVYATSSKGDMYENVENVMKGSTAASAPSVVTKLKQTKPAKHPKVPRRNKEGLTYADLDLEEPATKPGQKLMIRGLDDRTDYAEIDINRRADLLQPKENFQKSH